LKLFKLLLQLAKFYFAGRRLMALTDEQKNVIREATEGVTLQPVAERLTVGETLDFWSKHKNKAWVAILLIVGAVGGNVDELYKAIPDVHGVTELKVQVKELRSDVDELMKGTPSVYKPTPADRPAPELPPLPPSDDGFRAERPSR
jgi:hypothetical protein